MYDASGAVVEPSGHELKDHWDSYIDDLRTVIENLTYSWGLVLWSELGLSLSNWTRGVGVPKRLTTAPDDAFYVSHITDIRTVVNGIESFWSINRTAWTDDPITPKYNSSGVYLGPGFSEANQWVYFRELREAVSRLSMLPFRAYSADSGV